MPKPHTRYGYWTFGWLQAEQQIARSNAFNERWDQLTKIRKLIYNDFVTPALTNPLTPNEHAKLCQYGTEMAEWQTLINNDIETANQHDLNKFATSIKKTALKAIKLCIKYKNYDNITSVNYNAQTKMIQINGKDYYYLGNSHSVSQKRPTKAQAAAHSKANEEFGNNVQFWYYFFLAIIVLLFILSSLTS